MFRSKKNRLEKDSRAGLARFSIFAGLTPEQMQKIEKIVSIKEYEASSLIAAEGEAGDELFLLLEGMVQVSKKLTLLDSAGDKDIMDKSLVQLKAENAPYFGEMAILNEGHRRSATVKAVSACCVGAIKRKNLILVCDQDKELGYAILFNIAKHLVDNLEKANQDILKLTTAFSLALQN